MKPIISLFSSHCTCPYFTFTLLLLLVFASFIGECTKSPRQAVPPTASSSGQTGTPSLPTKEVAKTEKPPNALILLGPGLIPLASSLRLSLLLPSANNSLAVASWNGHTYFVRLRALAIHIRWHRTTPTAAADPDHHQQQSSSPLATLPLLFEFHVYGHHFLINFKIIFFEFF